MSKRRLTKQQTRRIREKHEDNITCSESSHNNAHDGLVVTHFGQELDIECSKSQLIYRCKQRANVGNIVVGDNIIWQPTQETEHNKDALCGIVISIKPRHNEIFRPDKFGKLKLVAANIDQMLITIAPKPEPHNNLIDRYIIAAENDNVTPIIVINKQDLLTSPNQSPETLKIVQKIIQYRLLYESLGYTILETSKHDNPSLDALRVALIDKNSIFVGQSGVGKSSLIKSMLNNDNDSSPNNNNKQHNIKIGALSHSHDKGRHTTTHSELYHFASGGNCIDSPGIREFGLWHLSAADIEKTFADLRPHIALCQFRNCSHINEPNCGIKQAIKNKEVSALRVESFLNIIQSLDDVIIQKKKLHDKNRFKSRK